jgi:signal peptidase I
VEQRRGGRRLWGWVITAITVVVVVVAGFMLVPAVLGFERYVIESGSMEPTLPVGSIVYAEATPPEELKVEDIITYKPPPEFGVDDLVTHRIVDISPEKLNEPRPDAGAPDERTPAPEPRLIFTTKGDANKGVDPWKFSLEAEGAAREEAHVPYVGYVYLALAIPWVRLLVIVVPAILIAVLVAISLWRSAGEEQKAERARIAREKHDREAATAEKEPV